MRMGQGVRTGLGHGGIICVLQTQFSSFNLNQFNIDKPCILGSQIMKSNIKKTPVKFGEDRLYFQRFILIFVFAPNQ